MSITIHGVKVTRVQPELFTADIDGENTIKPYNFTGTLSEVYEQICDSKGMEI